MWSSCIPFACSHGQEIVILYETRDGARNLEQYPISTIYEFQIKRYVHRKK